jgi:signal transduction histidine kinase
MRHKQFICFYLAIFSLNNVFAQQNFVVKQFNSTNGLPQNSINGMQMDEHGYMWLATEGGIVKYDGNKFKTYKECVGKPIESDRIKGLAKTIKNEIIAYDIFGRIYKIKDNELDLIGKNKTLYIMGALPNINAINFIQCISQKKGYDWLYFQYPLHIFPLSEKKFVILGKGGFYLYQDTTFISLIPTKGHKITQTFFMNGNIFFFDAEKDIYKIDINKNNIEKIEMSGDILQNEYYTKTKTIEKIHWKISDNNVFMKLGEKLYKLEAEDKKISSQLVIDKLPEKCIINEILYNDINKAYYIGTDTRGLFAYKQKEILTLTYNNNNISISNSYYAQVALDSASILTYNLRKFSLKEITDYKFTDRILNTEGILKDKHGNIWYGMSEKIYRYDAKTKKHIFIPTDSDGRITSFLEDGDTTWVGTPRSFGYVYKDVYHNSYKEIIPHGENTIPFCMIKNQGKNIWMATCSGIISIPLLNKKAKPKVLLKNYCVRNLFVYQDLIFIGTYGYGYLVYQNGKFTQMPMDANNCLKSVHGFILDDSNYVWMSTNRGIFKTHIDEINSYLSDTTRNIYYSYFGQDDGLENIEFNGGCDPNCIKLKNGYFSFSSMEGLVWLNPLKVNDPYPKSSIFIDEISSDKKIIYNRSDIILPSNFNEVSFAISSPYWGNNANLQYEYNLEGLNNTWLQLKNGNLSISYPNLPSGKYILHIRKKAGKGYNNYVIKNIPFEIQKRVYEESWFFVMCIGFVILSIIGIVRVFSYRIRQRNLQLEKTIQSRISELLDLNEELSASEKKLKQSVDIKNMLIGIISHDIITPLRFISITAKNAFKGKNMLNMDFIKDIQTTSDKLHHNAQNILNWIRYQNDLIKVSKESVALNPLIEDQLDLIAEMTTQKRNTFVNDVSYDDVIFTDSTILNIIVQNIFSNANKYCQDATIHVSGEHIGDKYHLYIEDNGPGMSKENLMRIREIKALRSVEVLSNRSGIGYIIIVELLELLNSKINIESEEGKGTKITLIL